MESKKYDKAYWLVVAEMIDAFRIIPRAVLIAYGIMLYQVVTWFMGIPLPSTQHAALVTTVVGMAAVVIGLYNNSGRSWSGKVNISLNDKGLINESHNVL